MGNQVSTTGRKKSALSLLRQRVFPPDSEREESLSRQDTLQPAPSTNTSRSSKVDFALRSSKSSSSSISAATVQSIILPPQSIRTDGASTPKEKPCRLETPVPSLMTDVERMALCLDNMSPSESSAETQCTVETANAAVTSWSPSTLPRQEPQEPPVSSSSRPSSSSTTSKHPTLNRPLSSSESLPFRSHPFFPFRVPKLEKVPAPPLLPSHFDCYQSHRRMLVSRNIHCPIPCMVCRLEDEQVRWKCIWCCLRVCGRCMESLDKIRRRDLHTLVSKLERTSKGIAAGSEEGNVDSDREGVEAVRTSPAPAQAEIVDRGDQEVAS